MRVFSEPRGRGLGGFWRIDQIVASGPNLPFIRYSDAALQAVGGDIRCACEFELNLNSHIRDEAALCVSNLNDRFLHSIGVPSLRKNRPSEFALIMSTSEHVVKSSGRREPISR